MKTLSVVAFCLSMFSVGCATSNTCDTTEQDLSGGPKTIAALCQTAWQQDPETWFDGITQEQANEVTAELDTPDLNGDIVTPIDSRETTYNPDTKRFYVACPGKHAGEMVILTFH